MFDTNKKKDFFPQLKTEDIMNLKFGDSIDFRQPNGMFVPCRVTGLLHSVVLLRSQGPHAGDYFLFDRCDQNNWLKMATYGTISFESEKNYSEWTRNRARNMKTELEVYYKPMTTIENFNDTPSQIGVICDWDSSSNQVCVHAKDNVQDKHWIDIYNIDEIQSIEPAIVTK